MRVYEDTTSAPAHLLSLVLTKKYRSQSILCIQCLLRDPLPWLLFVFGPLGIF